MYLTPCWELLKQQNPSSPEDFMKCVRLCKPNLTEHDIVAWQRSTVDWTTNIFDFVWFYLKVEQGEKKWIPHIQNTWPKVKMILDEHSLESLFEKMSF